MFEFIVAACVVVAYGGEEVNPCFITESDKVYRSKARCEVALEEKKAEYWRTIEGTDLSMVTQGFCAEYDR